MVASFESPLTPNQYLHIEAESSIKHEYIDGDVYVMARATDAHVTMALNLAALLCSQVRGTGCRIYMADMKVRVKTCNCFYYPDIMVTCDRRDMETSTYKRFPKLIVEVLSVSTEAFDRGNKFFDYQTLDTLEEYVLINTQHQQVDCFRRNSDGLWVLQSYTNANKIFEIRSLEFIETFTALYEDVNEDVTLESLPAPEV